MTTSMTTPVSTAQKDIPAGDRLIHALDVPDAAAARRVVEQLGDTCSFYKIGLELFMAGGYFDLLDWLVARGNKVFVDLKFFDVPATVGKAVKQLQGRGATFATVHGNDAILEAAIANRGDTGILAVTVLTSLDDGDLRDLGFQADARSVVLSRARRALALGCDGVISSGLEAPDIRQETGEKLMIICPGIRPVVNRETDDQKRTVDVAGAFRNGADYIVVGRPIRDAADPAAAAAQIQETIDGFFGT